MAVFATVGYLAALIALWGILSVIVDRDVVDYPDAGTLLGPAMALAACVVTFVFVMRASAGPKPWRHVAGAAVITTVATLLVAGIGYSITRGDFAWMPAAALHFALGPFVPGAAVLSAAVVAASRAVTRRPGKGGPAAESFDRRPG
ncbi:DUF6121 family protein [Salinibacterium sp. G-O1]|uniref:DUF6121 family protein n=1 Tax=Salinibacterium sp. G-O1 TaxID=3046208 RepID=UPI0024BABEA9|nr:DUF6121 family protein [Salinibacterium sp. G-O1]MDJ0334135.1 DUF6121 family protein [Salinibacterium sp. G-O1]